MPRAHLSKRIADSEAIRLFAEYHISQVRRRKNGEIVAVKHSAWGWVDPRTYYAMQKLESVLPQVIQGGYRVKAALWGMQVSVLGVSIPLGGSIPAYAATKIGIAVAANDPKTVAEYSLALALPFGDIWILLRMLLDSVGLTQDLTKQGADLGFFGIIGYVWSHPEVLQPILRLLPF